MSDVDSVLNSLVDDATGVPFVVVEGSDERAALPPSPPRAVRVLGVDRSGMQGTTSSAVSGKIFPFVYVTSCFDCSICFDLVGKGGSFCMKRNCTFSSQEDTKTAFQGTEVMCFFICCSGEEGSTIIDAQPNMDEHRVPVKIKEEWQTQQQTLAKWRMALGAVEIADDVDNLTDEIKKEVTFLEDTLNSPLQCPP